MGRVVEGIWDKWRRRQSAPSRLLFLSMPRRGQLHHRRWMLALLLCALLLPAPLSHAAPSYDIAPGCINLIENGGFEVISPHWQIQPGSRPPMYTNEATLNGSLQSMRVGNGMELSNVESTSEVRYIPVQLPADATSIILRFRYSPRYDNVPGNDIQQADIYYHNTNQLAVSLLNAQANDSNWLMVEESLTGLRGQVISLRFRVHNDGLQGRTFMYLDNIEIEYCAQTPIPTHTHTPTGTPIVSPTWTVAPTWTPEPTQMFDPILPPPPVCDNNILPNGSFETPSNWHIGEDPVPPRYTNEQVRSGLRSVLMGNPPGGGANVITYSSIRQKISLPANTTSAQLRWWQMPLSQESPNLSPGNHEDRQEVILLTPNLRTIDVLYRIRLNDGVWQQQVLDLTEYAGQTFYVYFNVWNDANNVRTWMYLDDVELYACASAIPLSIIEPQAQPMPTTILPLPTPISPTLALPTETATLPLPTPIAQIELPTFTPMPTATTAGVLVAIVTETPPAGVATSDLLRAPEVSVDMPVVPQPSLLSRLGTIAILLTIIVIIGFLVAAIANRLRTAP